MQSALRDIIEGGETGLPGGLGMFLRTAEVADEGEERVLLEFPAGPALDLLEDLPARRSLQDAISRRIGRDIELEVRAAGSEAAPVRLTPEGLKEERVRKLSREEPALDRAVREWDLEMLD